MGVLEQVPSRASANGLQLFRGSFPFAPVEMHLKQEITIDVNS